MKRFVILLSALFLFGCTEDVANETQEIKVDNEQILAVVNNEEDGDYVLEMGQSTILFPSEDGLQITADLYLIDETSPLFILFHQAGWSRGEYEETALKLNIRGYNVMAIDQRSGMTVNGIDNETAKRAAEASLPRNHVDAAQDIRAAIEYANENFKMDLYLMGSSYSASLILVESEAYKEYVKALFAFSPGEYFLIEGQTIAMGVKDLSIPTFITSASHETSEWENIFENIAADNKFAFYPEGFGKHGSQSLWKTTRESMEFWEAMDFFIETLKEDAN